MSYLSFDIGLVAFVYKLGAIRTQRVVQTPHQPRVTNPGTDTIRPLSRTQSGWPVAGATRSLRSFAAARTSAETISFTPASGAGRPVTSP